MTEPFEKNVTGTIRSIMNNTPLFPVPKGDVWLGTDLLKQSGLSDTIENHFYMADRLGQEMICFSISDNSIAKPLLGYRYFECADLQKAVRIGGRFIAAVVDGPFHELVNNMGLINVLSGLGRNRRQIIKAYETEQAKIFDLISRCLGAGVKSVIWTE